MAFSRAAQPWWRPAAAAQQTELGTGRSVGCAVGQTGQGDGEQLNLVERLFWTL